MTPSGRMQLLAQDPAPVRPPIFTEHNAMKWLSYAGLGTAALALAPVVVPTFAGPMAQIAGGNALNLCGTGAATGMAATVSGLLAGVPLIGAGLASGGLVTVAAAAALTVGGMWLANYVEKHSPEGGFPWGKVIRWGSLATSVLVSLPAILPAISMGLNFFHFWLQGTDPTMLSQVADSIGKLGATGAFQGASMALSGASMGVVHTLTCALPMGLGAYFLGKHAGHAAKEQPRLSLPDLRQHAGRVTPPPPLQLATV